MIIGLGTAVNVACVVAGSLAGLGLGSRLPQRTRTTVTQVLGLCTLVIGAPSILPLLHAPLATAVRGGAVFLVVIVALVVGALLGSWWRLEDQVERLGGWLRARLVGGQSGSAEARTRFVDGFVTSSLVFCVGPMSILGSLQEGLGQGATTLFTKSVLDGVAAIAFASALGSGVLASAATVAVYQGGLTLLGWLLGGLLPPVHVDLVSVVGGVMLLGLGLRLLDAVQVRVADLLPALVVGPLLLALVQVLA